MSEVIYANSVTCASLQAKGLITSDERPMLRYIDGHYYWVLLTRPLCIAEEIDVIDSLIDHALFLEELLSKCNCTKVEK